MKGKSDQWREISKKEGQKKKQKTKELYLNKDENTPTKQEQEREKRKRGGGGGSVEQAERGIVIRIIDMRAFLPRWLRCDTVTLALNRDIPRWFLFWCFFVLCFWIFDSENPTFAYTLLAEQQKGKIGEGRRCCC